MSTTLTSAPAPETNVDQNATAPDTSTQQQSQQTQQSWYDGLPDDLKQEASLKNFKDVASLAKSYIHANKMVGADKIAVPGKHATKEDWNNIYRKLGLPESVDKYDIKAKEGNPEFVGKFKSKVFEAGVLPHQAQALLDWYDSEASAALASQEKEKEAKMAEGIKALQAEWGAAYDKHVGISQTAVTKFVPKDVIEYLEDTKLGNDPMIIKLIASIAKGTMSEDSMVVGGGGSNAMTPQEAKQKVESIMSDLKGPDYDRNHPGHNSAMQEVETLYKYMMHK